MFGYVSEEAIEDVKDTHYYAYRYAKDYQKDGDDLSDEAFAALLVTENFATAPGFIILETADGLKQYSKSVVKTQKSLSAYFEKHEKYASLINQSRLKDAKLNPKFFQDPEFVDAFTDYAQIDPGILEVQFRDREAFSELSGQDIVRNIVKPLNFTDDSINGREQFQKGLGVVGLLFGARNPLNKVTRNYLDTPNVKMAGMSDLVRKRAELRNVNPANLSNGSKGVLGEKRATITLQRAGYQEMPARLPSNNGFDGVFIRGSGNNIKDIIISESKFSKTGRASLSKTKKMGRQLSAEWIDENIKKMLRSSDPAVLQTGRLLRRNRSLIRTKANVLDPAGVNRWNRINIPKE